MITIEAKIIDDKIYPALGACSKLLSGISHKLYVDKHIRNKPLNELKSSYQIQYGISARHFNSIRSEVDAKAKANEEIHKNLLLKKEGQIKATQKKIKSLEKELSNSLEKKKSLQTFLKKSKQWRDNKRSTKKPKLAAKLKNETILELELEQRKNKFKLHQKKRRLLILKEDLILLKNRGLGLCFGSKELFQKQFHLKENKYKNHKEWKEDWDFSRNSQSFWLGSHEEKFRNLNAQYNPANKSLTLRMPYALEKAFGTHIVLSNLNFRYGQKKIEDAILNQVEIWDKKANRFKMKFRPVSYRILARKNGSDKVEFFCQAMFEERSIELSSDRRLGAIGIDLNIDHIAVCETDRFGNPISRTSFPYSTQDLSSHQITAVLSDHIAVICERAKATGKIIVCEKLDFEKKKQALRETTNSNFRRKLSSFAYRKFYNLLISRGKRDGIKVKDINPAFTSVIGFYKFQGYSNYTSHELAALSIARRGLGFSERTKIKSAPDGTVSNHGFDEAPLFFTEKRVGHVWSYYSRNAVRIRNLISISSQTRRKQTQVNNPRHPSGYREVLLRMRCDQLGICSHPLPSTKKRMFKGSIGSNNRFV